ncbi:MAG: helix-turn-helix domain-containing protein [Candidatus Thermoplasmatota archaeon]|nr:helix-turn-helix domain-containing protein [Candidatus Thermoplasmatota archaeon]
MKPSITDSIEALIEVERTDCEVTNQTMEISQKSAIKRIKVAPDQTVHKVNCGNDCRTIASSLKDKVSEIHYSGKSSLWVKAPSCSACKVLGNSDSQIVNSCGRGRDRVQYRILVRNKSALKKIIDELKEQHMNAELLEVHDWESLQLTPREDEILMFAFLNGYFDIDRGMSMTEMAKHFGIAPSSLSDSLRRALKKAVRGYLVSND